mmetsp:Transcript_28683/g.78882  ORF Transcript_28683/g.78882 Transcript_28683/m.78882 type:complete len:236 (-) Transcript_28683:289-996(-)
MHERGDREKGERRVRGLQPSRISGEHAKALVGEEEVEGRGVHETGGLQIPFLADPQQLEQILEGPRQQRRLQARDRVDGAEKHRGQDQVEWHVLRPCGPTELREVARRHVEKVHQAHKGVRDPRDRVHVQPIRRRPHAPEGEVQRHRRRLLRLERRNAGGSDGGRAFAADRRLRNGLRHLFAQRSEATRPLPAAPRQAPSGHGDERRRERRTGPETHGNGSHATHRRQGRWRFCC